jgi:hypothetical protein
VRGAPFAGLLSYLGAMSEGLPDDRAPSRDMYRDELARKGADNKCEACGHDQWVVSQNMFLLQALQPTGSLVPGEGVEVAAVFCNHCGLIRLHASAVLMKERHYREV